MGKKEISTITEAAGLAARAIARLEQTAAEVHANETARAAIGFDQGRFQCRH